MNYDVMEALKEAFCKELSEIKGDLDNNGGHFHSDREIDNAKDCIKAIKDLCKIEAMSTGSKMGVR